MGRTFLNSSQIAASGHFELPGDLSASEQEWWKKERRSRKDGSDDFTLFVLQNKAAEDVEVRVNGDKANNRYCQGGLNIKDDTVFFDSLLVVNQDSSNAISANEIIVYVDRPYEPVKEIANLLRKILNKLGVETS